MSGAGGSAGSGTGGGGIVIPIDCFDCAADTVCWSERCELHDIECKPRPLMCPTDGPVACGCDGEVYANACEAQKAGTDIWPADACKQRASLFRCEGSKSIFCKVNIEYCATGNLIEDHQQCLPVPEGCQGENVCDCIDCGNPGDLPDCDQPLPGEVRVVCQTLL